MQARPECYQNCNFSIHIVFVLLNPTFPLENLLSSIIQGHSSIVGQLQQLPSTQYQLKNFPTLKGEKFCILAKISNESYTRVLSKLQFFNTYRPFFLLSPTFPLENLLSSIFQGHSSIIGQLQQLPSRQSPVKNILTLKGEKL